MTKFAGADDLRAAEFVHTSLRGARFTGVDLSEAVIREADLCKVRMRAVDVRDSEIDAPWLFEAENYLLVNGVDVVPLVDAELNRRFPGRVERHADDPAGLRSAWSALERTWSATLERVQTMPTGTVDISIDGEWSFAQTLRHLIMATDTWLGRAILEKDQPYHPIGQPDSSYEDDGRSPFQTERPTYSDVLDVRAGRVAMMRDFLAAATADELAAPRKNPHAPEHEETVLSCLHTILEEEWEHHRYAVRDLDAIDVRTGVRTGARIAASERRRRPDDVR
ncbi:DinB family protein [Spelaeicoccus albus]|uniref:DinB-like domain-containing protein n=1 Tax=Spelaeicoccus albus TaxID=1280376 RepID=A0A7Z0D1Y5_9MICO|nr:DinB family protein [Spelaeicoccus albus]NYI67227.1 hypothetical protein [Spelaeicoccus albus]